MLLHIFFILTAGRRDSVRVRRRLKLYSSFKFLECDVKLLLSELKATGRCTEGGEKKRLFLGQVFLPCHGCHFLCVCYM